MDKFMEEEIAEYLAHFPNGISKKIKDYVNDEVFLESRYIFVHRKKKQQYGYCTNCKKEFKTESLKHNGKTICPKCKSNCMVKSSGMGRNYMVDEAYCVYYEKSLIDKNIIIARGIDVGRDYTGDYKKIKTEYKIKTWYIFDAKNKEGIMLSEPSWWGRTRGNNNQEQNKQ